MTLARRARRDAELPPADPSTPLVIVGVDGSSPAVAAVRWAGDYARMTGATLAIMTAWHWPPSYGSHPTYRGLDPAAEAREVAEKAATEVTLPAQQVQIDVREGGAGPVLAAAAEAANAVLLVVGRPAGGIPSSAFGSTSLHCVINATCPVIVVR